MHIHELAFGCTRRVAVLLGAEAALSVYLSGKTLVEHFLSCTRPSPLIGLAAQLAYACFPFVRRSGSPCGREG
jgi:hypothetical protein